MPSLGLEPTTVASNSDVLNMWLDINKVLLKAIKCCYYLTVITVDISVTVPKWLCHSITQEFPVYLVDTMRTAALSP